MKNKGTPPAGQVPGCLCIETPGNYVNKPVLFRLNPRDTFPEVGIVRGYRIAIQAEAGKVETSTRLIVQREGTPHAPEIRPEDVRILKPSRVKAFREIVNFINEVWK